MISHRGHNCLIFIDRTAMLFESSNIKPLVVYIGLNQTISTGVLRLKLLCVCSFLCFVLMVVSTVLPAKSDSDVMFFYSYHGLRIDRSLVY